MRFALHQTAFNFVLTLICFVPMVLGIANAMQVHQYVNRLFKSEVLQGSSDRTGEYTYQVPKLGLGMLREVFNSLEDPSHKKSMKLAGFSVSQPSLQQVLLGLAQSVEQNGS